MRLASIRRRLSRDHPRRCGAFVTVAAPVDVKEGSSPQVRGICKFLKRDIPYLRIIPASAGHFAKYHARARKPGDHPRRCGAFPPIFPTIPTSRGSSPQVRGIYLVSSAFLLGRGIIPAGAGHFLGGVLCCLVLGDHPRRCGAFSALHAIGYDRSGSSPQVRGICAIRGKYADYFGIIPAGAGHFVNLTLYRSRYTDHPRRCGAFQTCSAPSSRFLGSSPQVRGISPRLSGRTRFLRIIPAGAGHFGIAAIYLE